MDGLIFNDEAAIANVPVPFLTINSVAPTIMRSAPTEQKKFFLPKIAAGELHFSIGYSEPGAGTDLAVAAHHGGARRRRLRHQRPEDVDQPDRLRRLRLAGGAAPTPRPRSTAASRCSSCPTTAEGFSWTPVHTMAGSDTSATYYQDVRVPVDQPGRRGERRLEAGHQPAQPRARRAGRRRADLPGAQRGSRMGAEHQGRPTAAG